MTNPKYIDVVPEFIVEILSPSSGHTDKVHKLYLYRRHGVLHYWIVDPEDGVIQAFKLENKNYTVVPVGRKDFSHPDFPELQINLAKLVAKPV